MGETIENLWRRTVAQHGARLAVISGSGSWTYQQVDRASDLIATAITTALGNRSPRVGIYRVKDVGAVAAIHGILKTGRAYVPLSPHAHATHIQRVMDDEGLGAIVTSPRLAAHLVNRGRAEWRKRIAVEASGEDIVLVGCTHGNLVRTEERAKSRAAYVLYSSGSTGLPKGIEQSHESVLAFAGWAATEFELRPDDRLSCHAPLQFDLTIFDLFAPLIAGACVVLLDHRDTAFAAKVASIIDEQGISVWYSVPTALRDLVRVSHAFDLSSLRRILFAGERFPPSALKKLADRLPKARLSNLFGPTETNVCTFHHLSRTDADGSEHCPIGMPCPYAVVRILLETGRAACSGTGELLVAGPTVMSGYLNCPELNANAFVNLDGTLFYRTGDIVEYPSTGPMRFLGRRDRQVKVRGYRIELDEIERSLLECAQVSEAAAWICADEEGAPKILVTVSFMAGREPSVSLLRDQLSRMLSSAVLPSSIFKTDSLPRTSTGKVDYAELRRRFPS